LRFEFDIFDFNAMSKEPASQMKEIPTYGG